MASDFTDIFDSLISSEQQTQTSTSPTTGFGQDDDIFGQLIASEQQGAVPEADDTPDIFNQLIDSEAPRPGPSLPTADEVMAPRRLDARTASLPSRDFSTGRAQLAQEPIDIRRRVERGELTPEQGIASVERMKGVYEGEGDVIAAEGRAEQARAFARPLKSFMTGATWGISDLVMDRFLDDSAKAGLQPRNTREMMADGVANLGGGLFTGAKAFKIAQNRFGSDSLKKLIALRAGFGGATSALRNTSLAATSDNFTFQDALVNTLTDTVLSTVQVAPEIGVNAGFKNFLAQVSTDFGGRLLADKYITGRMDDITFRQWLAGELPSIASSIIFSGADLLDPGFAARQQGLRMSSKVQKASRDAVNAVKSRAMKAEKNGFVDPNQQGFRGENGEPINPMDNLSPDLANITQKSGTQDVLPQAPARDGDGEVDAFNSKWDTVKDENRKWFERQNKSLWDSIGRMFWDADKPLKKVLERAGFKDALYNKVLMKSASSNAKLDYENASKRVYEGLKPSQEEALAKYIFAKRSFEVVELQEKRGGTAKNPGGVTKEEAQKFARYVESNPEMADIRNAAEEFWGEMRRIAKSQYDAGLISEKRLGEIQRDHKNYAPRVFLEKLEPNNLSAGWSPFKELAGGSEGPMQLDPRVMLAQMNAITSSRIAQNRANVSLLQSIRQQTAEEGSSQVGRLIRQDELRPDGSVDPKKLPDNEAVVFAYENGEKVNMAMPKSIAEYWNKSTPEVQKDLAEWNRWVGTLSGTGVLKGVATTYNPFFWMSNLPRDMQHSWFTTREYSNIGPLAFVQQIGDIGSVWKDAFNRTGLHHDYIRHGGGQDYLTTQGMMSKAPWDRSAIKGAEGMLSKLGRVISHLNETSEIVVRLAVYKRALARTGDKTEAAFIARNMLDFAQGGKVAKRLDAAIPYLNASIQGTRATFRQFKTDPKLATFKAAQLIGLGAMFELINREFAGDEYDAVSERERSSKWIFMLPFKVQDSEGNTRRAYIGIPKDQGQQVFSAMGESFMSGMSGRPWGGASMEALKELFTGGALPIDSSKAPPVLAAARAYFENYDTWTKQKIWQGDPATSPFMERKLTTPGYATAIADLAAKAGFEGISPERLDASVNKVIPNHNPLITIPQNMVDAISGEVSKETMVEFNRRMPGLNRVMRYTRPLNITEKQIQMAERLGIDYTTLSPTELYNQIDKLSTERADVRVDLNVELERIIRDIRAGDATQQELMQFLMRQTPEERTRLRRNISTKYPEFKQLTSRLRSRQSTRSRRRTRE